MRCSKVFIDYRARRRGSRLPIGRTECFRPAVGFGRDSDRRVTVTDEIRRHQLYSRRRWRDN